MVSSAADHKSAKHGVSNRHLAFGAAVMTGVNVVKVGIQFAMLPIMARLLGPDAYGLYALALPTVAFMLMLADGGLGNSLAREELDAKAVWSSAFWAVHFIAILLALAVTGWSFVLAAITHQPHLPALMAALSISLLFLAAGVLPGARMLRHGRLHVGSIADLAGTLAGAGLGITLAFRGAGTWALVAQYVTAFGVRAVIMNVVAFEAPALIFNFRLLHAHLLLGGSIIGSKLADYIGRMVENTLISSMLGARVLGIYGFANQVPRFLCESASNPLWAALYVQAVQKPQDAVLRAYYELSRALGIVLFPCTILAAVGSSQIIQLFLGPAWHAAALPLAILLPSFTFATIGPLTSALLYAKGRGGLQLWISSSFVAGRIAAALTAGWLGLTGVAAIVAAANIICGMIAIIGPARMIGASPPQLLRGLVGPFVCAIAAGGICGSLISACHPRTGPLILIELLSLLCYLALLFALEHRRLREDFKMLSVLLKRKPA